jgi:phage terminase Nu1 subunit (DNA packaging protein)
LPEFTQRDGEVYSSTIEGLTSALAISEKTYRTWRSRGCPGKTGRGYPVTGASKWARSNVWRPDHSSGVASAENATDKEIEERTKVVELGLLETKLERDNLKLRSELGELVERIAAKATFEEMINRIKTQLKAAMKVIADQVNPDDRADAYANLQHQLRLTFKTMEGWSVE